MTETPAPSPDPASAPAPTPAPAPAPAPVHWKLVVDCAAPHAQADFWGGALAYTVEDRSARGERLRGLGAVPEELTVESHGRRVWRDLAAVRHPGDPYRRAAGRASSGGWFCR